MSSRSRPIPSLNQSQSPSIRSAPRTSSTTVNTINKIGHQIHKKMKKEYKGKMKKIMLDQIGSKQHPPILSHLQKMSQIPELNPLQKGCWDHHLFYAVEIIRSIPNPHIVIGFLDQYRDRMYLRAAAREYFDELLGNYADLNEFEMFRKLFYFTWRLRYKFVYDALDSFLNKAIKSKRMGRSLPEFNLDDFKTVEDYNKIVVHHVVYPKIVSFAINSRASTYKLLGEGRAYAQVATYNIKKDRVGGFGGIKDQLWTEREKKKIQDALERETTNHPLYQPQKAAYPIDWRLLNGFGDAMDQRINEKISELNRIYGKNR